jgi:hypothetical protein
MNYIDTETAKVTLPKIQNGLNKYLHIMNSFDSCDVSNNVEFQKSFNGFYRIRQRRPKFYKCYYDYMEQHKNTSLAFEDVVTYFYNSLNRIESSFSSKLLATVNPNMPVWDSIVLNNLELKPPAYYKTNRLQNIIELYSHIVNWYTEYLETQNSTDVLKVFDDIYPNTKLTHVKKIDLVLWSIRE